MDEKTKALDEMREKFFPVSISFACNDEYGNFTGIPTAIEIGSDLLCLENRWWNPRSPRLNFSVKRILGNGGFAASKVEGSVKISRRTFPIVGFKSHWGNIIWDLVIVDIPTAQRFVEYIQQLGCFRVDSAMENWGDKFDAPKFEWSDEEIEDLKKYGYQRP